MDKETIKIPSLVNPDNFNKVNVITPSTKSNIKWNLNKILLILFVLFLIFFLYNCKYGMFRHMEDEPTPFSLVYSNSLI
jgi:uncharacterized integral membrane protein